MFLNFQRVRVFEVNIYFLFLNFWSMLVNVALLFKFLVVICAKYIVFFLKNWHIFVANQNVYSLFY